MAPTNAIAGLQDRHCPIRPSAPEHTSGGPQESQYSSRTELVAALAHHGWFSEADADYAADNLGINWSTQALKAARYWNGIVSNTRSEMVDYLKGRGFTSAQANYAVTTLGLKDVTPTPSADVTTPPAVTPTTPATSPTQPSDNPTMGING